MNIMEEITKKYEELLRSYEAITRQLEFQAYHDPLTGLLNRNSLAYILRVEAKRVQALGRFKLELLFIDLDNFKRVNDMLGHAKGDEVLKKVANIIRESIREEDIPVRYGGDEFIVLLRTKTPGIGHIVGERIRRKIEESFGEFGLSASWGVAVFPDDAQEPEELINIADKRMYQMKKLKKIKKQAVS